MFHLILSRFASVMRKYKSDQSNVQHKNSITWLKDGALKSTTDFSPDTSYTAEKVRNISLSVKRSTFYSFEKKLLESRLQRICNL